MNHVKKKETGKTGVWSRMADISSYNREDACLASKLKKKKESFLANGEVLLPLGDRKKTEDSPRHRDCKPNMRLKNSAGRGKLTPLKTKEPRTNSRDERIKNGEVGCPCKVFSDGCEEKARCRKPLPGPWAGIKTICLNDRRSRENPTLITGGDSRSMKLLLRAEEKKHDGLFTGSRRKKKGKARNKREGRNLRRGSACPEGGKGYLFRDQSVERRWDRGLAITRAGSGEKRPPFGRLRCFQRHWGGKKVPLGHEDTRCKEEAGSIQTSTGKGGRRIAQGDRNRETRCRLDDARQSSARSGKRGL